MKTWEHLDIENRKTISSCISHDHKLINISKILNYYLRGIWREIKRNRIEISIGFKNNGKRTKKWSYVCTECKKRDSNCPYTKYKYDAKIAQKKADANLINSMKGIDIDNNEFNKLDSIIKKGTDENKSIYQIKIKK